MEFTAALQVAVFVALLAVIAMAVLLIPIAIIGMYQLIQFAHMANRLNADVQSLLSDSRELIRSVNDLTKQAHRQMEDVTRVTDTVKHWTERADRLVNAAGSAIEPPVFSLARNMDILRVGVRAFLQTLLSTSQTKHIREEKDHV